MRVVAVGILALLHLSATSCAPGRLFDLAPLDSGDGSPVDALWVETESSQSTVAASYERAWLDHLIFHVSVVNHSDTTLVIDPEKFTLALSSPDGPLTRKLMQPLQAESHERVSARLTREINIGTGLTGATRSLVGVVFTAVAVAAVGADVITGGPLPSFAYAEEDEPVMVDAWAIRRGEAARAQERLGRTLLARIELAPGQWVAGEIWFSARPLQKLLGPRPDIETELTMTSGRTQREVECALTLRAPPAIGGQLIDYYVWSE